MNVTLKPISTLRIILNRKLRQRIVIGILEKNKYFVKEYTRFCPVTVEGLNSSYETLAHEINYYAMENGVWKKSILNGIILHLIEKDLRKLIRRSNR